MALFGSQRDFSLFRGLNRELLGNVITQQVGYYMYKIAESTTNMYGEALEKFFNGPLKLNCLITRGDQVWGIDDFGPDVNREVSFAFLRDDLLDYDFTPQVGDIVMWNENYYEVDGVTENQLFVGKSPDYPYSPGLENYGRSVSIICSSHLVPSDKVQLTKER
jgi:hypothetical protein